MRDRIGRAAALALLAWTGCAPPPAATCSAQETLCDGVTCANLADDPENCGACGTVCPDGEVCSVGRCTLDCDRGSTACGEACVDTDSDPANCGGCSVACANGQPCSMGACVPECVDGTTLCGVKCVD